MASRVCSAWCPFFIGDPQFFPCGEKWSGNETKLRLNTGPRVRLRFPYFKHTIYRNSYLPTSLSLSHTHTHTHTHTQTHTDTDTPYKQHTRARTTLVHTHTHTPDFCNLFIHLLYGWGQDTQNPSRKQLLSVDIFKNQVRQFRTPGS